MSYLTKSYEYLTEMLKFRTYGTKEIELQSTEDSSQTSLPSQEEASYLSYDPFSSTTSNQFGQQLVTSASKNEAIRKWRECSFLPEVDTAITEISNEAIAYDEIEDTIKINLADIELPDTIKTKIEESFENILYLLDFSEKGDELFKQWYIDGQLNFEVCYDNARMREGIRKLILMTPYNLNTFIDAKTKQKKYYYGDDSWNNNYKKIDETKVFLDEQVTHINSGLWAMDRKFPISYLNKAVKPINQLSLIEDSLVIYRITRSPEKLAFYIATGKLPKPKAEEYMNSIIAKYRQKRVYNTDSGTIENKNRSLSILENYFFPVDANGTSSRVETVAGQAPNFTSFEDVDYFINKVYKALHIPINRRAPDSRTTINNTVDIEKDELKFFKFILKLRKRFNNLFIDLLKKDLLAKNVLSLNDWIAIQEKIKFTYANSNEYSEIKANQVMGMRLDAANSAMSLIDAGVISLPFVQGKIMRLTEEEIQQINVENGSKKENEDMENHSFGNEYSVSKRNFPSSSNEIPEVPEPEEPPKPSSIPTGNETTPTKPISPTAGAGESVINNGNVLNEKMKILASLSEGDVLTNGQRSFKVVNGRLIEC